MQAYLKKHAYLLLITWPDSCLLDKASFLTKKKKKGKNLISLADAQLSSCTGAVTNNHLSHSWGGNYSLRYCFVGYCCVRFLSLAADFSRISEDGPCPVTWTLHLQNETLPIEDVLVGVNLISRWDNKIYMLQTSGHVLLLVCSWLLNRIPKKKEGLFFSFPMC